MILTNDKLLTDCHPSSDISWEEFMNDCEKIVNMPEVYSDEWFSNDETLVKDEKDNNKRPDHLLNTNSVIKVRNKR